MANTRPIRRGRIPFRRGKRWLSKALHPVRWLDCNSSQGNPLLQCEQTTHDQLCTPQAPLELLVGDLDWDWSDASEVRIDRIVGTLSWSVRFQSDASDLGSGAALMLRFGILATEETDRVYQTIDLWDPESIEEYEWMWLGQHTLAPDWDGLEAIWKSSKSIDIPLDVRTRRKLGKKDSVVLYTQVKRMSDTAPGDVISFNSNVAWMLRAIIRS